MSGIISEELYRKIDEERIKQALADGNCNDAYVLFKYSVLTKEEFNMLQQHTNYGVFDKQMKDYLMEKEKEQIERAFRDYQDEAAAVLFKFSNHLTKMDFKEIERKWRVPKNGNREAQAFIEPSWELVLNIISTKISKPSFDTWIKNTKGESEGETIRVYCQNSFQKDWLEERYNTLFSETIEQVFGKEHKIKYIFEVESE
jgi:hypothetical protein